MPQLRPCAAGRTVAALLVAAASLACQTRQPCTGTVRGADGGPVAGAAVVFVATSPAGLLGDEVDRVVATTDDAGRFAAALRTGLVYAVWAIGPADAAGRRAVAPAAARGVTGRELTLVAEPPRRPWRLQVTGSAPWLADGPLTLRLHGPLGAVLGADVLVPGDGAVTLPPCPTATPLVTLHDGGGGCLACEVVRGPRPRTAPSRWAANRPTSRSRCRCSAGPSPTCSASTSTADR